MNAELLEHGIKTVRRGCDVYLSRNGVEIHRPHVDRCKEACIIMFNVVIIGG